ncbi:MAG: L-lactate dehydrogenase [Alphaproteobacteria bacterium]|nr:L-lactate dehydrogenase [Alphaproteobacteria bacterium]MBU1514761.1 L-lactate dehydrogenase [Alphaproteobacteria bacterium]MBU2093892.1 L-lactate dehydrogenase [Alphaproteobacteria bacterium]MBU2153319.1 L-lactate dehydrogenase [Alphaproteobacteria bacterium]MBU2309747.1 L-lactate dehydrogenase [Alphaproteobacteria bacterium]
MKAASISDFRELARRRLPNIFFEYIDGGSYAEETLRRNVGDLEAIALRQLVMRDTTKLDMSVQTLGQTMNMPVGLSPVGMAGMYARRGETQAARAAAKAGVPFCLSTVSVCSIEEVAATGTPPWFQLYMLKDRGYMRELLARVKAVGSPVLVFTVDLPTPGSRYRDIRSGFTGAGKLEAMMVQAWEGVTHPAWTWDVFVNGRPHTLGSVQAAVTEGKRVNDFLSWIGRNFDRSVTWKDLDWVRETWDGPIVVKGVLDAADARDAVKAGAQGLVVSNHGGRQLDGVKSSISALPRIAQAVGGDLEVYMDGGVRSGLDVLKALALGAKACFVGRPWAWALGAGGQPAIERMLDILRAELAVAMILTGCTDVRDAGRSLLDEG